MPIYFGPDDVEQLVPPGSYINVKDFASAEELAEYIKVCVRAPNQAYDDRKGSASLTLHEVESIT